MFSISKYTILYTICVLIFVTSAASNEYGLKEGSRIEHKFVCPHNGSITGINYRFTVKIDQIEFICTSSMGNTTFGPYGEGNGKPGSLSCPEQHYISSFFGSNTTKLSRLGIRCRHQDDIHSEGVLGGEFGEEIGTNFDDLALSIGAKPISVTVKTVNDSIVDAIQVGYEAYNGHVLDSEYGWGPLHGQSSHENHQKMKYIACPDDGAFFNFEYTHSGSILNSIKFYCKSSEGVTTEGPFGIPESKTKSNGCTERQHIRFFTGETKNFLSKLAGPCVASKSSATKNETENIINKGDENLFDTKEDRRIEDSSDRNERETGFTDEFFAKNGARPVRIKLFYGKFIYGIRIQYKKIGVELNCKWNRLQLTGPRTFPRFVGFELLGTTIGASCSKSQQQLYLNVIQSESYSEVNTTSWTRSYFINFVGGLVTSAGFWEKLTGLGGDLSVGANIEIGGGDQWPYGESTMSESGTGKSHKAIINYVGPGAAIVVGYMKTYQLNYTNTEVIYHFGCEQGSKMPQKGETITITGKEYKHVHFHDYHYPFGNTTKCTTKLRVCISRIRLDKTVRSLRLFKRKITKEVKRCINNK